MNYDEYQKEIDNYLMIRQEQMCNCHHLFVKLEEGYYFQGYYARDCGYKPCKVECVLCGLTNKYASNYKYYRTKDGYLIKPVLFSDREIKINNQIFQEQFFHAYSKDRKSFDESVFNLIKDEVLPTDHAMYLYQRALNLRLDDSYDSLFNTMRILNEIDLHILVRLSDNELLNTVTQNRSKVKIKK